MHTYVDLPPRSSRLLPRVSICRMRSRSPYIFPDQFESLTRSSHRSGSGERAAQERIGMSEDKAAALLFVSHLHGENSCARADIMETNRPRVAGGRRFLPPRISLPFSYVVFDLGWIDDTRDAGGRRHHQQARRNAVLTSGEWRCERDRVRRRVEGEGKWIRRATESRGRKRWSLRKPRRDPSSLCDIEVHEGLSSIEGQTFQHRAQKIADTLIFASISFGYIRTSY